MKKLFLIVILIMTFMLGQSAPILAADPIELKIATILPEDSELGEAIKYFKQLANITSESLEFLNIKEDNFMNAPHKLLIVDDSKMMRKAIREIFADDDRIEVAGEAADGEAALEIIPQIIILVHTPL